MVTNFNKKENREFFNDKFWFKTVGIFLLLILVVLIFADYKIYQKKQELNAQINAYKKQIIDIEKSSQNLKDEIANTDNTDYLEKLGYEQFNETKPGETEYMFVKVPQKAETNPLPKNFGDSWSGWLSGAWQWIKSKF